MSPHEPHRGEVEAAELLRLRTQSWADAACIEQLQSEVARLNGVLLRIAMPRHKIVYCADGHEENVLLARAALEGK